MVIDAPREQWLIDVRDEISSLYPKDFIESHESMIRSWLSRLSRGEFPLEWFMEELADSWRDDPRFLA